MERGHEILERKEEKTNLLNAQKWFAVEVVHSIFSVLEMRISVMTGLNRLLDCLGVLKLNETKACYMLDFTTKNFLSWDEPVMTRQSMMLP